MSAAGIDRTAVDTVIISHYHGDHINGLLMDDNSLSYPKAEILVPAIEHTFWMDDGEMGRASPGRMQSNFKNVRRVFNLEVMKRVKTYEWDKEVVTRGYRERHARPHARPHFICNRFGPETVCMCSPT